jgi:hypothetical protein
MKCEGNINIDFREIYYDHWKWMELSIRQLISRSRCDGRVIYLDALCSFR